MTKPRYWYQGRFTHVLCLEKEHHAAKNNTCHRKAPTGAISRKSNTKRKYLGTVVLSQTNPEITFKKKQRGITLLEDERANRK
jgi:hypothetical protein